MTTKKRRKPLTKEEKVGIITKAIHTGATVLFSHMEAFTKMSKYLGKRDLIEDKPHEVRLVLTKFNRKRYVVSLFDSKDNDKIWGFVELVPDDPYAHGSMYPGTIKYVTRGIIRDSEFIELSKKKEKSK